MKVPGTNHWTIREFPQLGGEEHFEQNGGHAPVRNSSPSIWRAYFTHNASMMQFQYIRNHGTSIPLILWNPEAILRYWAIQQLSWIVILLLQHGMYLFHSFFHKGSSHSFLEGWENVPCVSIYMCFTQSICIDIQIPKHSSVSPLNKNLQVANFQRCECMCQPLNASCCTVLL